MRTTTTTPRLVVSLFALLVLGILAALIAPVTAAQAASSTLGRLSAPAATVPGVPFTVTGRVNAKGGKVALQARTSKGWTQVAKATAKKTGRVTFRKVVLHTAGQLRLVAGTKVSNAVRVSAAPVAGTVTVLPGIAQPGAAPAAASNASIVTAKFTPARPGRKVVLQAQTTGGWTTLAKATEDATGSAVFTAPAPGTTVRAYTANPDGTQAAITTTTLTRDFTLDFNDEFTGPTLNPVWADHALGRNPAGGRSCSRADASARTLTGGVLKMGLALDTTNPGTCAKTGKPYLFNTQIATGGWSGENGQHGIEKRYTYQYGYAAARMKFHRNKGAHSSFWMVSENMDATPGDPTKGVEVDIAEWFGTKTDTTDGFMANIYHRNTDTTTAHVGGKHHVANHVTGGNFWNTYHVFSVQWTPTEYIFRIDGREFYRTTQAIAQTPEVLVLSMLTSDYEFTNHTNTTLTQTTDVDWVRVWNL